MGISDKRLKAFAVQGCYILCEGNARNYPVVSMVGPVEKDQIWAEKLYRRTTKVRQAG